MPSGPTHVMRHAVLSFAKALVRRLLNRGITGRRHISPSRLHQTHRLPLDATRHAAALFLVRKKMHVPHALRCNMPRDGFGRRSRFGLDVPVQRWYRST